MTSAQEARRWLISAEEELEFARFSVDGGYGAQACFAAQQSAEKAVKAVHYAGGARVVLGHSVRALIARLDPAVPGLRAVTEEARTLDLYYVPTRYPNGLDEGTPAEAFSVAQARHAIECAAKVLAAAKEYLRAEAGATEDVRGAPGTEAEGPADHGP